MYLIITEAFHNILANARHEIRRRENGKTERHRQQAKASKRKRSVSILLDPNRQLSEIMQLLRMCLSLSIICILKFLCHLSHLSDILRLVFVCHVASSIKKFTFWTLENYIANCHHVLCECVYIYTCMYMCVYIYMGFLIGLKNINGKQNEEIIKHSYFYRNFKEERRHLSSSKMNGHQPQGNHSKNPWGWTWRPQRRVMRRTEGKESECHSPGSRLDFAKERRHLTEFTGKRSFGLKQQGVS